MKLNSQNYHSREANEFYLSNSQYGDFMTCEAMALAKIRGDFVDPPNDACLIGSYVHAAVEGTLDEFKASEPALFKSNGELYAKYEYADRMVRALKNDKLIQYLLQGKKEVIMTAEMFGAPWKVKLDNYVRGRFFADLKTVASIRRKVWNQKYGYTNFVQAYEYPRQIAIYTEIEKRSWGSNSWIESFIIAVSKEEEPDKEVISIPFEDLEIELAEVEENMPRILAVKSGLEPPERCETCKYCRRTKQLTGAIHYMDLVS